MQGFYPSCLHRNLVKNTPSGKTEGFQYLGRSWASGWIYSQTILSHAGLEDLFGLSTNSLSSNLSFIRKRKLARRGTQMRKINHQPLIVIAFVFQD